MLQSWLCDAWWQRLKTLFPSWTDFGKLETGWRAMLSKCSHFAFETSILFYFFFVHSFLLFLSLSRHSTFYHLATNHYYIFPLPRLFWVLLYSPSVGMASIDLTDSPTVLWAETSVGDWPALSRLFWHCSRLSPEPSLAYDVAMARCLLLLLLLLDGGKKQWRVPDSSLIDVPLLLLWDTRFWWIKNEIKWPIFSGLSLPLS